MLEKIKLRILSYGLTEREIKVLLFLFLAFLSGLCLKFFTSDNLKFENFDYSKNDYFFEKYSSSSDSMLLMEERFSSINNSDSSIINVLTGFQSGKPKKSVMLREFKININKATQSELVLLPGIGNKMANRIISYREKHNGFKRKEDIMLVKGLGKKKFDELKNNIEVK